MIISHVDQAMRRGGDAGEEKQHAGVPLHQSKPSIECCEKFLHDLKAGLGGRLRRPSSAAAHIDKYSNLRVPA
jgi:hypothetical protein